MNEHPSLSAGCLSCGVDMNHRQLPWLGINPFPGFRSPAGAYYSVPLSVMYFPYFRNATTDFNSLRSSLISTVEDTSSFEFMLPEQIDAALRTFPVFDDVTRIDFMTRHEVAHSNVKSLAKTHIRLLTIKAWQILWRIINEQDENLWSELIQINTSIDICVANIALIEEVFATITAIMPLKRFVARAMPNHVLAIESESLASLQRRFGDNAVLLYDQFEEVYMTSLNSEGHLLSLVEFAENAMVLVSNLSIDDILKHMLFCLDALKNQPDYSILDDNAIDQLLDADNPFVNGKEYPPYMMLEDYLSEQSKDIAYFHHQWELFEKWKDPVWAVNENVFHDLSDLNWQDQANWWDVHGGTLHNPVIGSVIMDKARFWSFMHAGPIGRSGHYSGRISVNMSEGSIGIVFVPSVSENGKSVTLWPKILMQEDSLRIEGSHVRRRYFSHVDEMLWWEGLRMQCNLQCGIGCPLRRVRGCCGRLNDMQRVWDAGYRHGVAMEMWSRPARCFEKGVGATRVGRGFLQNYAERALIDDVRRKLRGFGKQLGKLRQ